MAQRKKRPRNISQLAKAIVDEATTEAEPEPASQQVEAGRLGGLKGGKARAERLSAKRRSEIARKAAAARWGRS